MDSILWANNYNKTNCKKMCFAATLALFYAGWTLSILTEELLGRPYITLGFAAWLLMLPMAGPV